MGILTLCYEFATLIARKECVCNYKCELFMRMNGTLDDVGEKLNSTVPRDSFVQAGVQYGSGGSGTLQLQGRINNSDFVVIAVTPISGGAAVTDITAEGIYSADVSVCSEVQLIMTVDGSVLASLSLTSA